MTPAINTATASGINFKVHSYTHNTSNTAYGDEASRKLGINAEQIFKTLVCETQDSELVVGIISVSAQLNLKAMASSVNAKKVALADKDKVERITGYVIGGISPLGQKRALRTIIDTPAQQYPTIYISAGRRGLEIELNPCDLVKLANAQFSAISA